MVISLSLLCLYDFGVTTQVIQSQVMYNEADAGTNGALKPCTTPQT